MSLLIGTPFRKGGLATTGSVTPGHLLRTRLRGFHSLRSSMAIRAGASAEQVAQMLGHTTQVSREHYIQVGSRGEEDQHFEAEPLPFASGQI